MPAQSAAESRRSTLRSSTPTTITPTGANTEVFPPPVLSREGDPLRMSSNSTPPSINQERKQRRRSGSIKSRMSNHEPEASGPNNSSMPKRAVGKFTQWHLPKNMQWIPANWTRKKLKPVIRCAVAAWLSVVLFLVPRVQRFIGQAAFVILVAFIVAPPVEPFMVVLERELLILTFSAIGWAWSCLGIFLAYLARSNKRSGVTLFQAITGRYLEVAPTAIISVFIFLGTATFLYIRARQGPGPYLFASVLACLTIDMTLTTAALFPFPYYLVGRTLMLPLTFHSAISILCSMFIFPESMSSQYTERAQEVLLPLESALDMHRTMLKTPPDSTEFASLSFTINDKVGSAEDALVPLVASGRLLRSDLIYSRFSPSDFKPLKDGLGRLIGRANGMSMYFGLIDPTRERFMVTPAPSLPGTATPSRQPSPERGGRDHRDERGKDETLTATSSYEPSTLGHVSWRRGRRSPSPLATPTHGPSSHSHSPLVHPHTHSHAHPHAHGHSHLHRAHLHHLHHALLHPKQNSMHEHAVGIFEVQKYLNLEATRFHTPYAELYTRQTLDLLQESCDDLLAVSHESTMAIREWLGTLLQGRLRFWVPEAERRSEHDRRVDHLRQVRDRLSVELGVFRKEKRHTVLDPYRPAFEPETENEQDIPPHRYLFNCYVYQYHLMQFAEYALKLIDHFISLEEKRQKETLWTPVQHLFLWSKYSISEQTEKDDEENPDLVQGIEVDEATIPQFRDPDALPPNTIFELVSSYIYYAVVSMFNGNVLYAIKAGVLTVVLCIPSFTKSSAEFAYRNRFVWAIFMGQLSLARFRGDTAFAFVSRVVATFFGCVIGVVMWYISAGGNRNGNVYGLGAVFAVFLPFIFYARLYWSAHPLTNIITFVTTVLVVGYSWQDVLLPLPSGAGVGFTVAWRRFLLVVIGVTAAYIASFFPPSTSIRQYHRKLMSTTCSELGSIYCQIISFANSRRQTEVPEIFNNSLAVRRKLKKAHAIRQNIRYEISLRGKWPAKRYLSILDNQLQIAYALSHLLSIVERLEYSWSKAFLRRTRFNDTDFQGDILAVITMISTALRTGQPLSQITPCPLIDRFMLRYHGLEVIHKEFQDDYGLPRKLSLDTLKNEQYMIFCVGVSTAFSIMTRLDRLMVATKEVVGEQYYIYGLAPGSHGGVEMGSRAESIQMRPPPSIV